MRPCRALRVIKLQWLSVGIPSAPLAWPPRRGIRKDPGRVQLCAISSASRRLRSRTLSACGADCHGHWPPYCLCASFWHQWSPFACFCRFCSLSSHISSLMTALPTLSAVPHCVAHTRPVSTSRVEAYALSVASSNYQTVRYSSNLPSSSSTSVANPHTPNQVSRVLSCTYLQLSSILENFKEGF